MGARGRGFAGRTPGLSAIPIPEVTGQHQHTDLRGRRGLTFFCFPPRPKGDRQMVSGQAKRTRTRRTWADTGSGHVRAARHRRAQIPSYHFDRRPCCRNQPIFLDPRHTRHRHSPLFCLCMPFLGYQRWSASSLEGYCLFLSVSSLNNTSLPHSPVISYQGPFFPLQLRSCTEIELFLFNESLSYATSSSFNPHP